MGGEVSVGIVYRGIVLRAHKPEMLAAWAKDFKPAGWEKIVDAYDPTAVAKRRDRGVQLHNKKLIKNI